MAISTYDLITIISNLKINILRKMVLKKYGLDWSNTDSGSRRGVQCRDSGICI